MKSGTGVILSKHYPLVSKHNYGKSPFLVGKSTINGPFSIAMLNFQRVGFIVNMNVYL